MTLLFLFGAAIFFLWPKEETPEVTPEELTELTELHPIVEEKKNELLRRSEEKGINIEIIEGYRTPEEQNNLYEKGRSQQGSVVTNAQGGESYHNYGLAIDFALETEDGEIIWNTEYDGNENGKSDWKEAAEIAKELGFEWGGDWPGLRDYSHLQLETDLSMHELQR